MSRELIEGKSAVLIIGGIMAFAILFWLFASVNIQSFFGLASADSNSSSIPIRVGWQNTWVDSAYVAEPLMHTNILMSKGLKAEFTSFSSGAPMIEAAVANNQDIFFIGRAPAMVLMSKSDDWVIVSKLDSFPISLVAGTNSGVYSIKDLKGKKIGLPFATSPYTIVQMALIQEGLVPQKDVTLLNVKPADFALVLESKSVDAVSFGEPTGTLLISKGLAHRIYSSSDLGVVMVSKKFLRLNPEKVRLFLDSLKEANYFFAQNKDTVLNWYSADSTLAINIARTIPTIEPNYDANLLTQVSLYITPVDIDAAQKKTDFEYSQGIISKPLQFIDFLDQNYLN